VAACSRSVDPRHALAPAGDAFTVALTAVVLDGLIVAPPDPLDTDG
jgi:hypothetical protein